MGKPHATGPRVKSQHTEPFDLPERVVHKRTWITRIAVDRSCYVLAVHDAAHALIDEPLRGCD